MEKLLLDEMWLKWAAICCLLICFGFACLPLSASAQLGESMRLEGRMAMRRGLESLLQWQRDDGTWEADPSATAQALMALNMSGMDSEWQELSQAYAKAEKWLLNWLQQELTGKQEHDPATLAIAVRPLLRQPGKLTPEQSRAVQQSLTVGQLFANPQQDLPYILEAAALLQAPPTTWARWREQFSESQLTEKTTAIGHEVATAWLLGVQVSNLTPKVKPAINETPASIDFTDLYWLTRTSRILNRQARTNFADWQSIIMARMLNAQKQDGGWGEMQADHCHRVHDTALALQIMAFCLLEK